MLDYIKSEELMLVREAEHMKKLLELPDLSVDVVAVMSALYRTGWRDCWLEEAKNGRTGNVH